MERIEYYFKAVTMNHKSSDKFNSPTQRKTYDKKDSKHQTNARKYMIPQKASANKVSYVA